MSLEVIEAQTGEQPVATVLILHGLGADGRDFVPVAEQLDLSSIGPIRFLFPNAPVIPVSINGGYQMPAWYDILGADITARQDEKGMRQTQGSMNQLIEREIERGIPARRIVIAGFSQGCAMALMTGLRFPERLAGIMGLSGYLPLAATLATERSPANADVPVFFGARHARRRGAAAPRHRLTRRPDRSGLPGGLAHLRNGAFGLRGRDCRHASMAASRAGVGTLPCLALKQPGAGPDQFIVYPVDQAVSPLKQSVSSYQINSYRSARCCYRVARPAVRRNRRAS